MLSNKIIWAIIMVALFFLSGCGSSDTTNEVNKLITEAKESDNLIETIADETNAEEASEEVTLPEYADKILRLIEKSDGYYSFYSTIYTDDNNDEKNIESGFSAYDYEEEKFVFVSPWNYKEIKELLGSSNQKHVEVGEKLLEVYHKGVSKYLERLND